MGTTNQVREKRPMVSPQMGLPVRIQRVRQLLCVQISQCRVFFLQQDYQNPNIPNSKEAQAAHCVAICQGWLVPFQCSIADAAGTQSASDCEVLRGAKWDTGFVVQLVWRSFPMLSDGRKKLMDQMKTLYEYGYNMGIIWVWVLNLGPLHDHGMAMDGFILRRTTGESVHWV